MRQHGLHVRVVEHVRGELDGLEREVEHADAAGLGGGGGVSERWGEGGVSG